mmetsp:Transcript_8424/g.26132  ORF Transcript_8424/g.26132 Transcript_8424/m.26132 type:complete len:99 (-) Transcript_8424:1169-1465(-)
MNVAAIAKAMTTDVPLTGSPLMAVAALIGICNPEGSTMIKLDAPCQAVALKEDRAVMARATVVEAIVATDIHVVLMATPMAAMTTVPTVTAHQGACDE